MLSNKLIDPLSDKVKDFVGLFRTPGRAALFRHLLTEKGIASQALVESLLPWVIRSENLPMLQIFLQAGIDLNSRIAYDDSQSKSILSYAAMHSSLNVVRILVEAGAAVNGSGLDMYDGLSPLYKAVKEANIETVIYLVKVNADPNCTSIHGPKPVPVLNLAISKGDPEMVEVLINAGSRINPQPTDNCCFPLNQIFHDSTICGLAERKSIMEILLNAGADANLKSSDLSFRTPLEEAALDGDVELVRLLLAYGASLTRNTLRYAKQSGNQELVNELGGKESSPHERLDIPSTLRQAVEKGQLQVVRSLLAAGIPLELTHQCYKTEPTLLQAAAAQRNVDLVGILLEAGADVNSINLCPSCDDNTF